MTSHLEAALQQDLNQIRSKVTEMGDLAVNAIEASIRAVIERDRQLAYAVILRDQYIDDLEKQLDRLCLEFLVRHQPAASLLRFAYASIKVNLELERVGDYAESIAREALRLAQVDEPLPLDLLRQIADLAVPMLRDAIKAFVEQDVELARHTIPADDAVDLARDTINATLTQAYRDGKLPFEALTPLTQVMRRLERVSDQARNIGMETLYMCTGEYAKHPGSDVMRILFVDFDNSCRGPMAEAIGTALSQPGFVFTSAGIEPKPVDPKTVEFMAAKGLDVSRTIPKTLVQVPHLDHQDVVVILDPVAKRMFPRGTRNGVLIEWPVESPRSVQGDGEKVNAAYEATFQFLDSQIRDLVSAIRKTNRL